MSEEMSEFKREGDEEIIKYTKRGNLITPQVEQWRGGERPNTDTRLRENALDEAEMRKALEMAEKVSGGIPVGFAAAGVFVPEEYKKFVSVVESGIKRLSNFEKGAAIGKRLAIRGYMEKGAAVLRIGVWDGENWVGGTDGFLLMQVNGEDIETSVERFVYSAPAKQKED